MIRYAEPVQFPNNADDIGWLIDPDESNPAVLQTWYPESNYTEMHRVTLRPRFIHGPDGPGWHWHPAGEERMADVIGRMGTARNLGLDVDHKDWIKNLDELHMDRHIGRPLNSKELWVATDGQEGEPPPEVDWRPTESIPEDFYGYARTNYADQLDPAEQAGWEAQIDANPLDALTHRAHADWLQDRGHDQEAEFRRAMGSWMSSHHYFPPYDPGHDSESPWRVTPHHFPKATNPLDMPRRTVGEPLYVEPEEYPYYGVETDRFDGNEFSHRELRWPTYRGMEEAFRRAHRAGRQLQPPEQLSRYGAEDYFTAPDVQPATIRPKDYLGRELDDEMLDWARRDEQVAGELRSIVHPDEHTALDELIGDMGKSFTVPAPTVEPAPIAPDVQSTETPVPSDPGTNPTVPDVQPTEPEPVGRPLRWESPEHFEESLVSALTAGHTDPTQHRQRAEAARFVASRLTPTVYQRLSENRITSLVSHQDVPAISSAWKRLTGEDDGAVEGYYDSATGEMAVNGEDPAGTLAHEMAHALDSSGLGGYWQISTSDEWKSAWRRELCSGEPSEYAATDPTEGFAEFCRLLWAHPEGRNVAAHKFKSCSLLAYKYGIV